MSHVYSSHQVRIQRCCFTCVWFHFTCYQWRSFVNGVLNVTDSRSSKTNIYLQHVHWQQFIYSSLINSSSVFISVLIQVHLFYHHSRLHCWYHSPYNDQNKTTVQHKQYYNSFSSSHSLSPAVCVQRLTLLPAVRLQLPLHHHWSK